MTGRGDLFGEMREMKEEEEENRLCSCVALHVPLKLTSTALMLAK